jgi:hypothetical protein
LLPALALVAFSSLIVFLRLSISVLSKRTSRPRGFPL